MKTVEELAEIVQDLLTEVYSDYSNFLDSEGYIELNEEMHTDSVLEAVFEDEGFSHLIGTQEFDTICREVYKAIPPSFFKDIYSDFKEIAEDEAAYQRNPLAYYGMSTRDFM